MELLNLEQAGQQLAGWSRILLLSHDRPDGDALGSMVALRTMLEALGKQATVCVYDKIPPRYECLERISICTHRSDLPGGSVDDHFDAIVILDTCSWSQLEPAADLLRGTRLPKLIIDHHATRDDLKAASSQAEYLIDVSASATCLILYELAEKMRWPIPEPAAISLFAGMATDTGWFRFSNTDSRTLRAETNLVSSGLRLDVLYGWLMDSYPLARLRVLAHALRSLQIHADGLLATMQIRPEDFAAANATPADTEDIVNEPLKVREVIASVLLIDAGDGRVRVNFRSKSPEVVGYDLDMAAVAAKFGGGGHKRAAGARVGEPLNVVLPKVVSAVSEMISRAKGN